MASFVDQLRHHRRKFLFLIAVLATFAVVCQGQDSLSISSGEDLLPCVYRGMPYMHGEDWKVDECTTCACDNATVTCVIESCQPAFCPEPIKPAGACCFLCPYNLRVKKVSPMITSRNTISEGGDNRVTLDVPIKNDDKMDTTGVSGEGLWKLAVWASGNEDGRGPRFGYTRNILTEEQMAQYYKKKEKFAFTGIDFEFNDPMAECDDMRYICVRIDRGDNPITTGNLAFEYNGMPDESVQTACTGSPDCKGIVAQNIDWDLEPIEPVYPGRPTSVSLDNTVTFRDNNPTLSGDGLWKMGLFGSRNPDGTGDKFGYVSQTLSRPQQAQTLRENTPLMLTNVETDFEIGSVGCNEYGYLCVDFTSGDMPNPSYFFRVEGAADASREANTIVSCREQECLANAWAVRDFDWSLTPTDRVIPGRETEVSLDSTVTFADDNREVSGSGLWRMGLFGSRNPDGRGDRFNYKRQTLNPQQEGITLEANSGMLEIPGATTPFEIGSVGCNEYGYVCAEFYRGDDPDPLYYFRVEGSANDSPEENTLIDCKEQECLSRAVFRDLEADMGDQILVENKNNFVNVDVTGITADDSTTVLGQNLWKLGAYASQNPDGQGPKVGLVEQILDPGQAATDLNEGENLPLESIDFDFDMTGLRCEDAPYICYDLDKDPDTSVSFEFEARPDDSVTTTCIDFRDRCKGAKAIDMDWDFDAADAPFDQPTPLTVDANVNFDPDSPDVTGNGLWSLGMFASQNPDGEGPRRDEVTQMLEPAGQATPLREGGPLRLNDANVQFPLNELGCDDYGYLCIEFKKGQAPSPNFNLEIEGDEDSIISCKEQQCRGISIHDNTLSISFVSCLNQATSTLNIPNMAMG